VAWVPGHKPVAHVLIQPDAVHEVVQGLVERLAHGVVVGAGGVDEADIVLGEADRRQRPQGDAVFFRVLATGECTVQAKRWKKPDWMQPVSNSWRTYSSASTVSCTVWVGKPYIR
jgi:hypothetical protein